eukprot:356355-Chlamydomonas_euryale.AAC.6
MQTPLVRGCDACLFGTSEVDAGCVVQLSATFASGADLLKVRTAWTERAHSPLPCSRRLLNGEPPKP